MCGTGRFLVPLLEKGYPVVGFDYSQHMLEVCRKKCKKIKKTTKLTKASFETFTTQEKFELIYIPSGSFCLLTTLQQVTKALTVISNLLTPSGKFVFEIETLHAKCEPQGVWQGNFVNKPDGSKIVLNILSRFDPASKVQTTLCRYEVWEKNTIALQEVEDFRLKLYEYQEIDELLKQYGFQILGKW